MSLTVTGKLVPGISAKLVETPVFKLVRTKAKTSLKAHWYSPYSLDANKKSKLKLFEIGIKSNSKKATSVIVDVCPLLLLMVCKKESVLVLI